MPEIVGAMLQFDFGDIAGEPAQLFGRRTQSTPGEVDCRLRDIENGDVLVAAEKKVVNECGFAAAHIYDRG
ncbi:MAG: hypothetical protein WBL70_12605 [Candidatus Acidiferrales bacterium]